MILVYTLPTALVLAISPLLLNGITIATIAWTFAYIRYATRRGEEMRRREEMEAAQGQVEVFHTASEGGTLKAQPVQTEEMSKAELVNEELPLATTFTCSQRECVSLFADPCILRNAQGQSRPVHIASPLCYCCKEAIM